MEEIIKPVSKELLKAELTEDKRLRMTNKSNNQIYIITHQNAPNVMREIGRLREIAFRAAGGGTGLSMDIDEYDTMEHPYKQLIVWNPEPEEILENLQFGLHWLPDAPENSFYSPDQEDVALPFPELLANVGDEVTPVDVVAERAGQPVPEVVTQLLELELAGWIAAVPGGYVRLRRACHVRRTNVFV